MKYLNHCNGETTDDTRARSALRHRPTFAGPKKTPNQASPLRHVPLQISSELDQHGNLRSLVPLVAPVIVQAGSLLALLLVPTVVVINFAYRHAREMAGIIRLLV